jgi:tetratricopeptide (TPR) repeat protein
VKKKFDDLRENLAEFVEQTDYRCLLLGCTPEEAPYAAQFLEGVDLSRPEDYVLTFVEAFITPSAYLDGLVCRLAEQLGAADEVRRARGEDPFPAPPAELGDPARPLAERLGHLLCFLANLLPNEREHAFVVAFLPFENRDNDAYCRLMASLLPVPEAPPWMAPLRIVLADDRRERQLAHLSREQSAPSVLYYEVDFSTPALTDALSRDAADPSVPMPQRMASLLQLAALDFSYRRFDAAIQKYGVLHEYYRDPPLPTMQALCLQGLGDSLHASGKSGAGKRALQSALALALEHRALVPLVQSLLSMVGVCEALGHHADTESYAESGRKAAEASMNAPVYVTFVEKKADAQLAQDKPAEAVETYRKCVTLAELYELFSIWKSVLHKLGAVYREARMRTEAEGIERELSRAKALEEKRSAVDAGKSDDEPSAIGAAA